MSLDILIVDDEVDICTLVAGILADEGYAPRQATKPQEALAQIQTRCPCLVLLDVWLGDSTLDGLVLLKQIKENYPHLPVIMMSGHGTFEMAVKAIRQGAYDFIEKPFQTDRLLLSICRALEALKLRQENQLMRSKFGEESPCWGKSQVIQSLRTTLQKVAVTNSRVLITGEAGVGKELIAREIHRQSSRSKGPFIVLHCATLHPDRFEEELFGIEKKSKNPTKLGTFEQAHGGTLLLDEVTDMPLLTQGKIVRILQEQTFVRVGGAHPVQVDVRVLASTRMDIPLALQREGFREDLYYRLNVVPLNIPPLRKRQEDIPELLDHFMERASRMLGLPSRHFSPEALTAFQTYDWPGNVHELKNIVERLLVMAPGDPDESLGLEVLPPEISGLLPPMLEAKQAGEVLLLPFKEARELFEKQYLLAQIAKFGGNVSQTAHFVGMERSSLHRKLKNLQLERNKKAFDL